MPNIDIMHGASILFADSTFNSEIETIDFDWEGEREVVEVTDNATTNLATSVSNYKQSLGRFIFGILNNQEMRVVCTHVKDAFVTNPLLAPPEVITITLPKTTEAFTVPATLTFTGGVRRIEGRWPMRGAGQLTLHLKVTSGSMVMVKEAVA
jgi:hypothetical protein